MRAVSVSVWKEFVSGCHSGHRRTDLLYPTVISGSKRGEDSEKWRDQI